MRVTLLLLTLVSLVPSPSWAHRRALCDGIKPVWIRLHQEGIVQIKSTEKITGVYPARPQGPGFVTFDKGSPDTIFRIDAAQMQTQHAAIHLNTVKHQCYMKLGKVKTRIDSTVTIDFPPDPLQLQVGLPPSLRESPVRQMWFKQWAPNKAAGPATVKAEAVKGTLPSWIKGIEVTLQWRYTMPGFEGFTMLLTNTLAVPEAVPLHRLADPQGRIHSSHMTDTLNTRSWREDGMMMPGEQALFHIVYEVGGGRRG